MKKNKIKQIVSILMLLFVVQFVSIQQVNANPFTNAWKKITGFFKPKKEKPKKKSHKQTTKESGLDGVSGADIDNNKVNNTQLDGITSADRKPTEEELSGTPGEIAPTSVGAGTDTATAGANNSDAFSEAKSQYPDLAPWFAPYKFHKNTQKERKESGEGFFMNKSDGLHEIEGSQYTAKHLIVVTEKGDFDLGDYGLEESNMVSRNRSKTDKVVMKYREGIMDFVTQRIYFTGRYIEYRPSVSVKIQKGKRGKKGDEVKRLSTYNKLNLRVNTGQKIPAQNFLFGGNVEPTLQSAQDISNHVNVVTGDSLADMLGKQAEIIAGESAVKEEGSENKESTNNKENTEEKENKNEPKNTEAPNDANLIIVHWLPDGGENMPSPKKKLRNSQKPATGDGTPDGSNAAKDNQSNIVADKDVPEEAAKMGIKHSAAYIKEHGEKKEITFTCYGGKQTKSEKYVTPFRSVAVSKGQYDSLVGSEMYIEGLSKDYPQADGLAQIQDIGEKVTNTKWDLATDTTTDEPFCNDTSKWKGNKKYTVYLLTPDKFNQDDKDTKEDKKTKISYLNNQKARQYVANINTENTYLSVYEKAYDTMTSIFIDEVLAEENKKEEENKESTEKTQEVDKSRADPDGDNAGGLNPGQGMGTFTRTAPDAPPGIYIIRNNSTVRKDRALIGWLQAGAGQEKGTYPRELLSIILEMKEEIKQLSFEETYRMQQIKEELEREKDNIWYDATTMISVIIGYLLISYAMLVVVVYWFDVFNVYTRGSVMMVISFGKWYPVSDKANLHIPKNQTNPKYVDFKDILIRAGIIIVIAVMFIRITPIISFIVNIKNEIAVRLGGLG